LRWARFGTGFTPRAEPSIEILKRSLEADLLRVEFSHCGRQAVLGEIVGIDPTGLGDQLHCPDRRPVMAVGEHVDVGMGHAAVVQRADRVGKPTVCEAAFAHERSQALTEWFFALMAHRTTC
jgi:hypothetical protein